MAILIKPDQAITKVYSSALLLAQTAKDAGVPRDSLERLLKAGVVLQPKQLDFSAAARSCDLPDGPTQVGFGGARGPGKSFALFAQAVIDDMQRFPGLKVLYLRKIAKNAREQFEDLRRSVLRGVTHAFNNGVLELPNGSRLFLGHFRHEKDIDQYLGIEYDLILVEEATTLSQSKYQALRDSNRSSKGFRPRIYSSTNPGGVGHSWFKAKFIVPARDQQARGVPQEGDTRFIFGTVDDNKFNDEGYVKKLEGNTGWKLRAYRFGDWDIAAGQFFTNWSHEHHVIKPFVVPLHWPAWGGFDYGFTHPTSAHVLRENDGMIYVTAEYCAAKKLPVQHAPEIKAMFLRQGLDMARVRPFVAGEDVFANKGDENARTIEKQYAQHGIIFGHANMDRINGAGELLMLLGDVHAKDKDGNPKPIAPRIQIFDTCTRLIECIPALQHDEHNPEDVLKVDVDEDGNGGDDPYDDLRYALMVKRASRAKPAVAGKRQMSGFKMQ